MSSKSLASPLIPYPTRTVLVFGSGAIGTAVAHSYAKQGCSLGLFGRNTARLSDLADECMRAGAKATLPIVADLTQLPETARGVAAAQAALGPFSIVVCAAGSFQGNSGLSFSAAMAPDLLAIERNIVHCTAPHLRKQEGGALVLLTSVMCKMGTTQVSNLPGMGAHLVWANGVLGLAEILFAELRQARVRVSCIVLGLTRSNYGRKLNQALGGYVSPALAKSEAQWVQPADVARAVDFCAASSLVVGTVSELSLQPCKMLERNQVFNDMTRVEKMVGELKLPFRDAQVALVTGCGKGIGRGVALEFARAGYDIAGITRTASDLDSLQVEVEKLGRTLLKLPLDVTDEGALERAVAEAVAHFGTLTVVVSNAGTNRRRVAALSDMKTWRQVIEVDLLAAMNLTRLTLPWLIRHALKQGKTRPSLIMVSTAYAHPKGIAMNGLASYVTAKHGSNAFARVVLQEVRDWGLQVCSLDPSTVATDLGLRPPPSQKQGEEQIDSSLLLSPQCCGRLAVHLAGNAPNVSCQEVVLENFYHPFPRLRQVAAQFLAGKL